MKLKDHLIRILLIFAGLAVPSAISTALSLSGYLLGGFGTLILYAPFLFFIYRVYTGKIGPKLPPKPTDDSVPITPEMLAFSADNETAIEDDSALLIENEDGSLVRVPADKLDSWQAADHDAPLTPAEEQLKERILTKLYGPKPSEGSAQPPVPDTEPPQDEISNEEKILQMLTRINDRLDKLESSQPSVQEPPPKKEPPAKAEEPIGYIPNSGHTYIPWWRSGKTMARLAIFLIGAVIVYTIIYAAVSSVSTLVSPRISTSQPPVASTTPPPTPSADQAPESSLTYEERLDLLRQAGELQKARDAMPDPLEHPRNGYVFYTNSTLDRRTANLTIDASDQLSSLGFYLKLRDPETKDCALICYIRGKTKIVIGVPLGTYELVYASGFNWYGEDQLFGPDTRYYLVSDTFSFSKQPEFGNAQTAILTDPYSRNPVYSKISAEEF